MCHNTDRGGMGRLLIEKEKTRRKYKLIIERKLYVRDGVHVRAREENQTSRESI